jgi:WD40 repeat protein
VAYDPDGKWVASGGRDSVIRVWDATTLREIAVLKDCNGVSSLAFSPNGKRLFAGGIGWLTLWEIRMGVIGPPTTLQWENGAVTALALSPDGKTLAVGMYTWDKEALFRLAVSRERSARFILGQAQWVQLLDVSGETPQAGALLEGVGQLVSVLAFSPDGRTLAVGTNSTLGHWYLTGKMWWWFTVLIVLLLAAWLLADILVSVARRGARSSGRGSLRPNATRAKLTTYALLISILRPKGTRAKLTTYTLLISIILCSVGAWLAYCNLNSAHCRTLAVGTNSTLELWDLTGKTSRWWFTLAIALLLATLVLAGILVFVARRSARSSGRGWLRPKGTWAKLTTYTLLISIILCSAGAWLAYRNSKRPKFQDLGEGHQPLAMFFSPDSRELTTLGRDNEVRRWEATRLTPKGQSTLEGPKLEVEAAAFAPGGKVCATAGEDGTLWLWDLASSTPRGCNLLQKPHSKLSALAFAPDGKNLVAGSPESLLRLWDLREKTPSEKDLGPGHEMVVRSLAFSPDGATIGLGCLDKTIRLWDLSGKTPRERLVIHGLKDVAWRLALAPRARRIALGFSDNTVGLWDLAGKNPQEQAMLPGPDDTVSERDPNSVLTTPKLIFSPDGMTLAVSRTRLKLWDLRGKTPRELAVPRGNLRFRKELAFSPDSRSLALDNPDGPGVVLWDLVDRKPSCVLPVNPYSMAFTPDGRTLLSVGADGHHGWRVSAWDLQSKKSISGPALEGEILGWGGDFAPDGGTVANVNLLNNHISIWSTSTGRKLREFQLPPSESWCLFSDYAIAPDGRHLALRNANRTVSILRLWDNGASERSLLQCDENLRRNPHNAAALLERAKLYLPKGEQGQTDLHQGGELRRFGESGQKFASVAFLPDSRQGLSAGRDDTLSLRDLETGREIRRFPGKPCGGIHSLAVSPDGNHALTGCGDHTLRLWNLESGKELHRFKGHTDTVAGVAFSAAGRRALSASWDGTVRVWNTQSGRERAVFRGHRGRVWCVALAPNGKLAVSGGKDGRVRLWNPATGEEVCSLKGHTGSVYQVAFAADGRRLLTGGADATVRFWDLGTERELRRFTGHSKEVRAVALSADGRLALSGSLEGSVRLWETATGETLRTFKSSGKPVTSVALSPDGRLALSGSADGSVQLWQLPLTAEQAIADLTAAISLDKKCAEAYFTRGQLLARQKDYDGAIADFTRVIDLDPCHARAYYYRGLLYSEEEKYGPAKADLEIAITIDHKLAPKP